MNYSSAVRPLGATTTDVDAQQLLLASGDDDDEIVQRTVVGFDIYFYSLSLVIIPLGVVANLFSVCVFVTSPTFRANSTAQFLIALSITDCLVLVGDFLRCLSMLNPH